MPRFECRLRKLEAQLNDRSGLVPHTKPWWGYGRAMMDKLVAGEQLDELIPLQFIDALMAKAEIDNRVERKNGMVP